MTGRELLSGNQPERSRQSQFFHEIVDKLNPRLSKTQATETKLALPLAIHLADTIGLQAEACNSTSVSAFERGVVFLSLAAAFGTPYILGNNIYQQKIAKLYDKSERSEVLLDTADFDYGITPSVLNALIDAAWPGRLENLTPAQWVEKRFDVKKGENPIIELPFNLAEIKTVIQDIETQLRLPKGAIPPFLGLAFKEDISSFGLVLRECEDWVRKHELNHLKYPGIKIGRVGLILDEGWSNWSARLQVGYTEQKLLNFWHPNPDMNILRSLFNNNSELKTLIQTRYEQETMDASISFHAALLSTVEGLLGYQTLIFMHPSWEKAKASYYSEAGYEEPRTSKLFPPVFFDRPGII